MLESLGIEPEVELVYRALVGSVDATAPGLAEALELPLPEVERALATLVDVGLALRPDEASYAGAPPAVALGALITEHHQGLRLAEQALATLAEQHRSAVAGQSISDLIEVVTGVDAIRHRFQQVQQAADHEMRTFITAPFVAVRPGENAAEPAAVERGVRIRAVVERAALSEPGATAEAMESLRRGLELRVVEDSRSSWCWPTATSPWSRSRSGPAASPAPYSSSAAACSRRLRHCSKRCGARPTRSTCPASRAER